MLILVVWVEKKVDCRLSLSLSCLSTRNNLVDCLFDTCVGVKQSKREGLDSFDSTQTVRLFFFDS